MKITKQENIQEIYVPYTYGQLNQTSKKSEQAKTRLQKEVGEINN